MSDKPLSGAQGEQPRTIAVTGLGRVSGKPDRAELRLGVSTEASTAAEALRKNSDSVARLAEAVRTMGIPAAEIKTSHFRVNPRYSRVPENLTGFEVAHMLAITIGEVDRVGEIMDKAVDSGANRVHVIAFTFKEERLDQMRKLGMERALVDARAKAEVIARSLGVKILHVASATEESFPYRGPLMGEPVLTACTIMPPTQSEVSFTVRVTFVIE